MTPSSFDSPVDVRFGRGCAARMLDDLPRPLVIATGRNTIERSGLAHLEDDGAGVHVHRGIAPLPRQADVDDLAEELRRRQARCVVGLGGGSVLDATKVAAVLCGYDDTLASLEVRLTAGASVTRSLGLVSVPTTAGTGSEVTRWASLWTDAGDKWSFEQQGCFADRAHVDPALTDTMDARLTAATGLDAVTHAMEALWGEATDDASAADARLALGLLREHLPAAVTAAAEGRADPAARDGVALGALRAGLALSRTSSAAAHALSYVLTGRLGLEHGLAVGLLGRALLPTTAAAVPDRVERVLEGLGASSVEEAQGFIDLVLAGAGLSPSLASFGIGPETFDDVVAVALTSRRMANHPGPPSAETLRAVLEAVA